MKGRKYIPKARDRKETRTDKLNEEERGDHTSGSTGLPMVERRERRGREALADMYKTVTLAHPRSTAERSQRE